MCYHTAHLLWETNDVEREIANDAIEEARNGIGNDAAYNPAQTPRGASAHGANTPPPHCLTALGQRASCPLKSTTTNPLTT